MIKAGVVIVNRFCRPDNDTYQKYIDYLDKKEGQSPDAFMKYNLFNDYMDKPGRSTGLFTDSSSALSFSEKKRMKELFTSAQKNGSVMWQTVISFDNAWLQEQGLYNAASKTLDEEKIKEMTRGALHKLLKNEKILNAVWSASIHYDTDNIHVHVAIVEPEPMREKKLYQQYEYRPNADGIYVKQTNGTYVKANGRNENDKYGVPYPRYDRVALIKNGQPVMKEEYIGRMKLSSLEQAKKYVVDQALQQKDNNILINRIIRDQIVRTKKSMAISEDHDLAKQFIKIHKMLPREGNRGLWKYNTNIMEPLRGEIDKLTDMYLEKYHEKDMMKLEDVLFAQAEKYKKAYGDTGRDFEKSKMRELYERMGNAILSEMREYDRRVVEEEVNAKLDSSLPKTDEESEDLNSILKRSPIEKKGRINFKVKPKAVVLSELNRSISRMKKSLKSEREKALNMRVYRETEYKGKVSAEEVE